MIRCLPYYYKSILSRIILRFVAPKLNNFGQYFTVDIIKNESPYTGSNCSIMSPGLTPIFVENVLKHAPFDDWMNLESMYALIKNYT